MTVLEEKREQARANAANRRRDIERELRELKPSADVWSAFMALADHYGLRISDLGRASLSMVEHVVTSGNARQRQTELLREHDLLSGLLGLALLPDPIETITWPLPILQRETTVWVSVEVALPLKSGDYDVRLNDGAYENHRFDSETTNPDAMFEGIVQNNHGWRHVIAWKIP